MVRAPGFFCMPWYPAPQYPRRMATLRRLYLGRRGCPGSAAAEGEVGSASASGSDEEDILGRLAEGGEGGGEAAAIGDGPGVLDG